MACAIPFLPTQYGGYNMCTMKHLATPLPTPRKKYLTTVPNFDGTPRNTHCTQHATRNTLHATHTTYIQRTKVFISHAWKYDCAEVIGSIIEAAEKIQEDRDSTDPLYFWFDICTVCQHETGVVRSQDWWANTFKASIAKIGYTLLILMPWDNPTPMTRAWCLWEMLSTLSSGTTLRCQMPKVEREKFNTSMEEDPVAVTNAMKVFEKIDARNAEAWVEADRLMIFNSVEASPGGFHDLNRAIKDQMREWVVDTASDSSMTHPLRFSLTREH